MNEVVAIELSSDRQQLEYFKLLEKAPCLLQTISIEHEAQTDPNEHQKTGKTAIISEKACLSISDDLTLAVLIDSGTLYGKD